MIKSAFVSRPFAQTKKVAASIFIRRISLMSSACHGYESQRA
jgi:hypothetical protein